MIYVISRSFVGSQTLSQMLQFTKRWYQSCCSCTISWHDDHWRSICRLDRSSCIAASTPWIACGWSTHTCFLKRHRLFSAHRSSLCATLASLTPIHSMMKPFRRYNNLSWSSRLCDHVTIKLVDCSCVSRHRWCSSDAIARASWRYIIWSYYY